MDVHIDMFQMLTWFHSEKMKTIIHVDPWISMYDFFFPALQFTGCHGGK